MVRQHWSDGAETTFELFDNSYKTRHSSDINRRRNGRSQRSVARGGGGGGRGGAKGADRTRERSYPLLFGPSCFPTPFRRAGLSYQIIPCGTDMTHFRERGAHWIQLTGEVGHNLET